MKKLILALFAGILLFSCSQKAEKINRAFYYWKSSNWHLDESEEKIINENDVKKLYIKFFEVEKNDIMGIVPVAKTSLNMYNIDSIDSIEVVPTVYIKNEVFKDITQGALDTLADDVNFLIGKYSSNYMYRNKVIYEYQMDCDWTPSTKENYFYFLKKLKSLSGKKISCTLRLYPYKYPDKMGVPPVDSAMLMCYNLISPLEDHKRNSIFDENEFSAYLKTNNVYPLHLDIALPVFSWVQVYQNNHFTKLLYTDNTEIKKALTEQKPLWYSVNKDTVIDEFYLRRGDMVKIEEVSPEMLKNAIQQIKKHVMLDSEITVSLFHLDTQQLSQYSHEDIESFYSNFTE
ncbi:hypothetical protein KJK34_02810 [Flavobacterium sp. D11R37]|uniref:hypothetical protein n=1 Tax=Flavobacterium coralii TaxID=2838017 RepID=UPI001CA6BFDF|nr:hypothetical protein [Flavobacterium coralii]MBY8961677.1 hypothetical protein [Flavobacterium coralii]